MEKRWIALIIVSWMVSACPALAMGAENPPSAVEKHGETQTGKKAGFADPEKSASEKRRHGNRSADRKRTRYGTGYESRKQGSRSNTQSHQSGRSYSPGRSKRKR